MYKPTIPSLTASEAQSLMSMLRPMISEIQRDKAAWNTAKRAFWQRCDPSNPRTEIFFDKLNDARLHYEKLQHKEKRLSDIQRKLKNIVSYQAQQKAHHQNDVKCTAKHQEPQPIEPPVCQTSSGWSTLDSKINGGFTNGKVTGIFGKDYSGKTTVIENLTVNMLARGLKGVHFTTQSSKDQCKSRLATMWDNDDLVVAVHGCYEYAANTSCRIVNLNNNSDFSDIRHYINEDTDFICIDNIDMVDLKYHNVDKINELINIARELNIYAIFTSGKSDEYSGIRTPVDVMGSLENNLLITTNQEARQDFNAKLKVVRSVINEPHSNTDMTFNFNPLTKRLTELPTYTK